VNRARTIQVLSEQLVRALVLFEPQDQDFALEEIVAAARALRSRSNTGRYHLDFQEEPPTRPEGNQPALRKLQESVRDMRAAHDDRESKQQRLSARHKLLPPKK
jgi:hypothetical protein